MRYLATALGIVVLVGAIAIVKVTQVRTLMAAGKQQAQAGPPAEAVATAVAEEQSLGEGISAVGSVASVKGVTLSNDEPGIVRRIHFDSGDAVKVGQVLVELDADVERAQLANARARALYAQTTAVRTRALVASGSLAKAQLDADEATLAAARADVDSVEAQIARKTIRAPFTGRLGIRGVDLGQYLQAGTAITVLETVDAVHVDFTLPQQRLSDVKVDMPVRVTLSGEAGAPLDGTIGAISPQVDERTRSVQLRADLQNQGEALRPGMFVDVEVVLPGARQVVMVPQTAILHAPYGDSLFVAEARPADAGFAAETPSGKPVMAARQQFVRLGEGRGDYVAVLEGVHAGEQVVVGGGFKLRNGAPIYVDNAVKPTPSFTPAPENR